MELYRCRWKPGSLTATLSSNPGTSRPALTGDLLCDRLGARPEIQKKHNLSSPQDFGLGEVLQDFREKFCPVQGIQGARETGTWGP